MPATHKYQLPDRNTSLEVLLEDGNVWLNRNIFEERTI
jgi:hypothetical protein